MIGRDQLIDKSNNLRRPGQTFFNSPHATTQVQSKLRCPALTDFQGIVFTTLVTIFDLDVLLLENTSSAFDLVYLHHVNDDCR